MSNPYQTPAAELTLPSSSGQLGEPVRLGASRGIDWLGEGWRLFMRAPGMLLGISLTAVVLYTLVGLVPLLGSVAILLLWPALSAGLFLALKHAHEGQPVAFADLFAPFSSLSGLVTLGALYLLAMVAAAVVGAGAMGALGGLSMLAGLADNGVDHMSGMMSLAPGFLLAFLVFVTLVSLVAMGFIFAPILVHQQQVPAMEAIRLSFVACMRNMLPFLLWGLAFLIVGIVVGVLSALIPLLGGLLMLVFCLLLMPLSAASMYCAYRDIFWC